MMVERYYLSDAETIVDFLAFGLSGLPARPDVKKLLTPAIKCAFRDLCDDLREAGFCDLSCYPDAHCNNREFSCDVSFWEERDRIAKAVHLEVESELSDNWDHVRFDFDKLKKSVANLKVLVTRKTSCTRRTHQDFQRGIESHLTLWRQNINGHRYVWFDICENEDRSGGVIVVRQWTVLKNGVLSSIDHIRLEKHQDVPFRYLAG